jgi:hypothetical protein
MKRHAALHPLSRDHHDVLVHARRLRGLDARFTPEAALARFRGYAPTLLKHFAEEEAVLAPRIADGALIDRLLAEHAELRALAAGHDALRLGTRLREHVRFEEDLLYPHLEAALTAAGGEALAADGLAFRRRERPLSLDGGEACFL